MIRTALWALLIIAVLLAVSYMLRDRLPWVGELHQQLGLPTAPPQLDRLTVPEGKTVIYRWQDAQGNWHFDSRPPVGHDYERLVVDTDVNVVPGHALP